LLRLVDSVGIACQSKRESAFLPEPCICRLTPILALSRAAVYCTRVLRNDFLACYAKSTFREYGERRFGVRAVLLPIGREVFSSLIALPRERIGGPSLD
jgi:hypothetical protein